MTPTRLALAAALSFLLADAAWAQVSPGVSTGGAGNTGLPPPPDTGTGVRGAPRPAVPGTAVPEPDRAAEPGSAGVPGTTPGVNIGGTPTSGPPGTGGAAGGPSLGNR